MAPIDFANATGQLRLLIADVDEANPVLTDPMIAGYLAMRGIVDPLAPTTSLGAVKRAAADALDAIATSEALISKVIRTQTKSTDGAKVADAIRKHAAQLRAEADADDAVAADAEFGTYFGVAEFSPYPDGLAPEATEKWLWSF